MESIEFNRTGNFWIDNGIVGLFKILSCLIEDNKIEVKLSPTSLKIEGESIDSIIDALNKAKDEVVSHYLKQTGAGWIFKDNEFEVYRKTDFKMHLKSFFTGKTPKTEGALCIPEAKDSDLGSKGRRMTESEYKLFLDFKDKNSPVEIDDKKVPLTGKGFLNSAPRYEIGDVFNKSFLEKGKKICLISGENYKEADVINGMNYPFLTGKSGEMNFASYLEGKPYISSKYAFVTLFSFDRVHYQLQQNGLKNYFLFYDTNLEKLYQFDNVIELSLNSLTNKDDYCNFKLSIIGTEYENESLFGFLVSVYEQAKRTLNRDIRKDVYTKRVFTFSNDGNIFRYVSEYGSLAQLFDLFEAFNRADDEYFGFKYFLYLIAGFQKIIPTQRGVRYDTTWRNQLCEAILNFRSIARIVERFFGEVKLKDDKASSIAYLDKIFEVYNENNLADMNKDMVSKCKSIGTTIGIYSQKEEDKSVLFSLRNAKNRTEFLKVLSLIQFKIAESKKIEDNYKLRIYDEFFEGLPDSPQWEEYKALVSIFAMNSFLYKPEKKQN